MNILTEEEIFAAAIQKPSAERPAFLERACAGDATLRFAVEALIAAHDQPDSLLDVPAGNVTIDSPRRLAEGPGARIGPYKLLQQLGEGGMGAVYLAEQQVPVKRQVALKIIKAGMDSAQVIARFEQERQALAIMDHPHIAKVLEAGTTESGRPYFVMELVKGIPITRYCDQEHLSLKERLELFIPVCQAVQHAHQKGIIHRDLKPSNVLIALYDGRPIPKVIDFGVAKATSQKLIERTLFTEVGSIVGTLEYMAPEQAELNNLDIDTRADIYSLGVLLYELLTGAPPFSGQQLRAAGFGEMLRIIKEVEPQKPSTKLSGSAELPSIAANRKLEPARLTKLVRGDLDWIVMRCLEKERSRRYETASAFALDIQHYLGDEPVLAGPPSAAYRLKKFLRRHKGPVLAAVAIFVLLVSGIIGTTAGLIKAQQEEHKARDAALAEATQRQRAEQEEHKARAAALAEATQRQRAQEQEQQAKDERAVAETQRRRAEANEEKAQHNLYIANMHRIRFEMENNNVSAARALLDLYRPGTATKERPGWEWYYWDRACHAEVLTLRGHPNGVRDLAYSPDGTLLASAGSDRDPVVKIWNAVTGKELRALHGHEVLVSQVAFSPDGKILATCGGTATRTMKLWDTATWTELPDWKPEPGDKFYSVAFSPDGKTLAVAETKSKRIKFWDLALKKWAGQLPEGTSSYQIQYSPDGNLIALVKDGVELWDVNQRTPLRTLRGHSFFNLESAGSVSEAITALAFSPDGQLLATCSRDGTMRIREVNDGTEVRTITVMSARPAAQSGLTDLAFSPDGKYLATSGVGAPIKLWEVKTGREVRSFFGQVSTQRVSFSPDGARLASAGSGVINIWDATGESGQHLFLDEDAYSTRSPTFSPDGTLLAECFSYGANPGQVHVCDVDTGRVVAKLEHRPCKVRDLAFSSDSTRLATACVQRGSWEVRLWDLRTRQQVGVIPGFIDSITQLAFSPDDQLLATVAQRVDPDTQKRTSEVKIWDLKTLNEQQSFAGMAMDFNPSGATIAVMGNDKSLELFDVGTGQRLSGFPNRAGRTGVAFSRDGNRLCDGSTVWAVADGRELCVLKGNSVPARFSPDGMRLFSLLVTSRNSGSLQVWDAATGDLLASIPVQGSYELSLHPDGWRCAVATAFSSGTWIVDARPLTPELRRKRDAQNLVEHLIRKPLLKNELLEQLAGMKTISEPLRQEALALAAAVEVPMCFLGLAAWNIVHYPDRSEDQYRQALRWIEEANRVSPNDGVVLNVLGMALYRLGRFKEAAEQLQSAFKINTSGYFSPPALDLIFLAMAQHQLGLEEDARKTLAQARGPGMMVGDISPHVWSEAEALIEGKMQEEKK